MAKPVTTPDGSRKAAGNGSSKPRLSENSVPLTGDQQRTLCLNLFNRYWQDASKNGVNFDVIGTMSISAALFGIVAKHGKEEVVEFIGDLGKSVENNEFDSKRNA